MMCIVHDSEAYNKQLPGKQNAMSDLRISSLNGSCATELLPRLNEAKSAVLSLRRTDLLDCLLMKWLDGTLPRLPDASTALCSTAFCKVASDDALLEAFIASEGVTPFEVELDTLLVTATGNADTFRTRGG